MLATVVSALAALYFLVAPLYSLEGITVPDAIALALFVVIGAVTSGVCESLHRAWDRIVTVELSGSTIDTTDLKRAEEALRASEKRFQTFVEHASDAFFLHREDDGTILDVNQWACESLGYTR